mmetsp:Transcript_7907/g.23460  ORF Transcript_7907/g.23460 Transcript_7907/m.23460 type:complete len:511 (+) Transcript_7907:64-1596(+)
MHAVQSEGRGCARVGASKTSRLATRRPVHGPQDWRCSPIEAQVLRGKPTAALSASEGAQQGHQPILHRVKPLGRHDVGVHGPADHGEAEEAWESREEVQAVIAPVRDVPRPQLFIVHEVPLPLLEGAELLLRHLAVTIRVERRPDALAAHLRHLPAVDHDEVRLDVQKLHEHDVEGFVDLGDVGDRHRTVEDIRHRLEAEHRGDTTPDDEEHNDVLEGADGGQEEARHVEPVAVGLQDACHVVPELSCLGDHEQAHEGDHEPLHRVHAPASLYPGVLGHGGHRRGVRVDVVHDQEERKDLQGGHAQREEAGEVAVDEVLANLGLADRGHQVQGPHVPRQLDLLRLGDLLARPLEDVLGSVLGGLPTRLLPLRKRDLAIFVLVEGREHLGRRARHQGLLLVVLLLGVLLLLLLGPDDRHDDVVHEEHEGNHAAPVEDQEGVDEQSILRGGLVLRRRSGVAVDGFLVKLSEVLLAPQEGGSPQTMSQQHGRRGVVQTPSCFSSSAPCTALLH